MPRKSQPKPSEKSQGIKPEPNLTFPLPTNRKLNKLRTENKRNLNQKERNRFDSIESLRNFDVKKENQCIKPEPILLFQITGRGKGPT